MAESNAIIDMCNLALSLLGASSITSLTQGTTNADLCNLHYPRARDAVLSWQAWPFATVRQSLARMEALPPSDFSYYFIRPTMPAYIRLIDIDLTSRHVNFQHEVYVNPADPNDQKAVIATNVTSVTMRYVGRTSEGVWHPLCYDAVGLWMAARMAPAISGKPSLRETFLTELGFDAAGRVVGGVLSKLRDIAGYEDSPREIPMPTEYLQVRGGDFGAWSHYRW